MEIESIQIKKGFLKGEQKTKWDYLKKEISYIVSSI